MYKTGQYDSKYWHDSAFDASRAPDITAWRLARSIIEHENLLVQQRMLWFIASQAFFFILYFLLSERNEVVSYLFMQTVLSIFAIYMCLVIQNSINRAWDVTDKVTQDYNALLEQNGGKDAIVPILHNWNKKVRFFNQSSLPARTSLLWLVLSIPGITNPSYRSHEIMDAIITFFSTNPMVYLSLSGLIIIVSLNYVGRKRE